MFAPPKLRCEDSPAQTTPIVSNRSFVKTLRRSVQPARGELTFSSYRANRQRPSFVVESVLTLIYSLIYRD